MIRVRDRHGAVGAVGPLRPGPWATAVSVVRSAGVAAGLVAAFYLLPLDWHGGDLTAVTLVGGLVAAGLFFGWEVWLIKRSPSPRLKAAEAVSATVSLYLVLFASGYHLLERAVPGSFDEHLDRTDALYSRLHVHDVHHRRRWLRGAPETTAGPASARGARRHSSPRSRARRTAS
ncbi:hypothetical protein [Streptomyces capoamus]|uniref:hypothetical protein n=1 Tax=Streptomyces capoamus TaxID=68183 RepID=UPI00339A141F